MDVLSGLPAAKDGSKHILVLVDAFTKWVEVVHLCLSPDRAVRSDDLPDSGSPTLYPLSYFTLGKLVAI